MKKIFLALLVGSFIACTMHAAQIPTFDPIADATATPPGSAYVVGTPLAHQTNALGDQWYGINTAGSNASTALQITGTTLSYPGLPASAGNGILYRNVAAEGARMFVAANSSGFIQSNAVGQVYYSMVIRLDDITSLSATGDYVCGFNNQGTIADQSNQPSDYHSRLYFKKVSSTTYQIGFAKTSNPITYDQTQHSVGETVFVVASYEVAFDSNNLSPSDDSARLWINPASSSFGSASIPAENITVSATDTDEANFVSCFTIRENSTATPNVMIIDDVRIATNWATVTGAPFFRTQPIAATNVVFGSNVTLTVKANGNGSTPTFQWKRNGANVSDGATISGSRTASLTISPISGTNAGTYTCVVGNTITTVTSGSSVIAVTGDPRITQQPSNQSGPPGGSLSFSLTATGTPVVTYQWLRNGTTVTDGVSGTGTVYSGSQTSSVTLSQLNLADTGAIFSCIVSNGLNASITSSNVTLTVQDPAIVSQPLSTTVIYHSNAVFNAAGAGTGPLSYRWQRNGQNLTDGASSTGSGSTVSGSSTTSLTMAAVTYLDQGSYTITITNASSATSTSSAASLTVLDPYIVTQPSSTSILLGGSGSLSVGAVGTTPLTYQWFKGTNVLVDGTTVNNSVLAGTTTSSLTISSAVSKDSGTYTVVVNGPGNLPMASSNAIVTIITPASVTAINPPTRTQRVGDHLAFAATATGTGPLSYQWSFNGTAITGATNSVLSLTNIQLTSTGSYSVLVGNVAGTNATATATLNATTNYLRLYSTNLVVVRVGDGAQTLNNVAGNTLYLDQYRTDGTYVNTIMVPDAPTTAFGNQTIANVNIGGNVMLSGLGSGADAFYENVLTRSQNGHYLNFGAYNVAIPSLQSSINQAANIRGIAAVNALGFYQLAYTNSGLYSGGNIFFRSVCSDDGLVSFWTTGAASTPGIKYVQVGVSSYAGGSGIPALAGSNPGTRVVDIAGGNVTFTDSQGTIGVDALSGLPKPTSGTAAATGMIADTNSPNDFAVSPDLLTVYIADDKGFDGTGNGGGIQRWDTTTPGGGYTLSYVLGSGVGTNGVGCLTVDFSASPTWGPGVTGAVIYSTSFGKGNGLAKTVDTGASSTPTVLVSVPNSQILRGIRFGPTDAPVQITTQPQSQTGFIGQPVSLSVGATGDAPFSYQWQHNGSNIPGATAATLVLTNPVAADAGTYTATVSNLLPSSQVSDPATLTLNAVPPTMFAPLQSRVLRVGDHMAFAVGITGSAPFTYVWRKNGSVISSATGSALVLSNLQVGDSGTYDVTINNANGQVFSSATLGVTPSYLQLYPTNIVAMRIGDSAQALSGATGNTIYLDQFAPNGAYLNTVMIPDSTSAALIASGGLPEALYEGVMTRSQNGAYLNFPGFNVAQPYTGPGGVGAGNITVRGIGAIDAYGYYSLVLTNLSLYNANTQFRSVASQSGVTNFWTTGVASASFGVKYVHDGGATTAIAGGLAGTRVVDISPSGNLLFTDAGDVNLSGLNLVSSLPTQQTLGSLKIDVGTNASPNDFAPSPDSMTVYIADDENFTDSTGSGGIQRWDYNGSAYQYAYSLATGGNSLGGARCLCVDFSANGAWGPGVTGAVIFATTSEGATNSIVRIVDAGVGSTGTVVATAGVNQLYRGMRFGPTTQPTVTILNQPLPQTVGLGGTATFTTYAAGGPFTYQWQRNGANLTDGPSPSGSGAVISGSTSAVLTVSNAGVADSGAAYSVIVGNPTPNGSATSSTATLTVLYSQFGSGTTKPVIVNGDHTVQLNFSGSAGSSYRVWSTTNVALKPITTTWTLLTNGVFSGGADSFVDGNAPTFSQRFYTITIP
jgi:hypothetical protein